MIDEREMVTSYTEAWEVMYGRDGITAKAGSWFVKTFKEGHNTSLRQLAQEMLGTHAFEKLEESASLKPDACEFHPRALELLVREGVDYFPTLKLQNFFRSFSRQPDIGQCFGNSWMYMSAMNKPEPSDDRVVYVEGLVYGFLTKPVLHAWNAFGLPAKDAVDWSHYVGCEFSRYLGIPFTKAEYENMRDMIWSNDPKQPVSLFDVNFFPHCEEQILQILASRKVPVT